MQTENENGIEYLDFRFKLKGCQKITVDDYWKSTEGFNMSTLRPVTPIEI